MRARLQPEDFCSPDSYCSAYHCLSLRIPRKVGNLDDMVSIRGLYAITNGPRPDLRHAVAAALTGGARIVQYRDKTADQPRRSAEAMSIVDLCNRNSAISIINNDVKLARECGATGVHLDADDGEIAAARARLGNNVLIGVSCRDSVDRARLAVAAGADYVSFGAFHPSLTKPHAPPATPDLLRAARSLGVPVVAIGGISPDNAASLIDAGADCVAVISSLFDAADIEAAARQFSQLFS